MVSILLQEPTPTTDTYDSEYQQGAKMSPHRMIKNLVDSPFSIERLFVWSIGIVMLVGMIGMVVIGYQGREIPPQIQSAVMFCLGVAASSIKDWSKK